MLSPLFAEEDAPLLKAFLIKHLESSSEADPDVLSDYILALLRHDQPPDEVMQTCISQLTDFMNSDPTPFIRELFDALNTKSYLTPNKEAKKRPIDTVSPYPSAHPNKIHRQTYPQPQPYPYAVPSPTPIPHPQWPGVPPTRFATWPGQGPPPPGWNSNPAPVNVPMAVPISQAWPKVQPRPKMPRIKGTCFDYLEKGICLRGASCPYDHGIAPVVISPTGEIEGTDPYDPLRPNATAPVVPLSRPPTTSNRIEIHKGPNHYDKTNTTLVVEGIPSDKFDEETIRGYFSQFGLLKDVNLDVQFQKAILIYADHESAAKAWNDSRPVFNNRFVKIWWKKTDPMTQFAHSKHREPMIQAAATPQNTDLPSKDLSGAVVDDVELEIAREAARKAQKEHEEKQRRKMELEEKKAALEKQRLDLLERQRVERERLMEKIKRAGKAKENAKDELDRAANGRKTSNDSTTESREEGSGTPVVEPPPAKENGINGEQVTNTQESTTLESMRKAQLQKMLTDLQNQANALNIPPSEYAIPPLSDARTKTSFRGGYRGRGSARGAPRGRSRGGFSRSLDLRPKSIYITGILGTEKETSIREYITMNCAEAVCEPAVEDATGVIVKFKERYEAEQFLQRLTGAPLGPLTGTWYTPVSSKVQDDTSKDSVTETLAGEIEGLDKEYIYDEEEGEVVESEGRWKR